MESSRANGKYAVEENQQRLILRYVFVKEPTECLSNVWEGLLLREIVGTGWGTWSRSNLTGGLRWEVIIKLILKERETSMWSVFIRLRIRSGSGHVQSHVIETLASIKPMNCLASW